MKHFLRSQFDDIAQRMQEFAPGSEEQSSYISERREASQAIMKVLVRDVVYEH